MSELRDGWSEVSLGDVVRLRGEKATPATVPHIPFLGLEDVEAHTSRVIKYVPTTDVRSAGARFSAGEILYSRLRPYLNKVVTAELEGLASAEFLVLQPEIDIQGEFIRRRIMAEDFLAFAALLDRGDRPRVNFEQIAEFPIWLPPAPEQRRIVAKLDALLAGVARARKELDRVPILIAHHKQALLAAAFSGNLTREWREERSIDTPVEPRRPDELKKKFAGNDDDDFTPPYEVPESWRWLRLPELGGLDRGKSKHRPRNDPRLFGGMHPFVQTGEVRAADRFLRDYSQTYSEFGLAQSRLWPIGTVCITIAANIAETAILAIEACFPDSVVGFNSDEERTSPDYVEFFLRTARADLSRFAPATAQKNINLDILGRVRVPTAPLLEQAEILGRLEIGYAWLDAVALEHANSAKLLPKLEQAILARAFRGELVTQDPADEPASVLLERIRAERAAGGADTQQRKPRGPKPPRAPEEKAAMTKSRFDPDVKEQPYLAALLTKDEGGADVEALFRRADLPVADFYKQLAWEIAAGHVRDGGEMLEAA